MISRSSGVAEWTNTTIVTGDVAEAIAGPKHQPGKPLALFGSSTLTAHLLTAGLVDEVRVMVSPALLGAGMSLFAGLDGVCRSICCGSRRSGPATSCCATGPAPGVLRCLLTRANGRPAVADYLRRWDDTIFRPFALSVLRIEHGELAEVTAFAMDSFARFDLPASLPSAP